MTEYGVLIEDGVYRVFATEDGITKRPLGPRFAGPRLAGQYADLSAGRPISPLRRPVARTAEEPLGVAPLPSGLPDVATPPAADAVTPSDRVRATG